LVEWNFLRVYFFDEVFGGMKFKGDGENSQMDLRSSNARRRPRNEIMWDGMGSTDIC
jgi:hypothetical protein